MHRSTNEQQDVLALDVMGIKRCSRCGVEKPVAAFVPSRPGYCRPCWSKMAKAYRASLQPERRRRDLDRNNAWQLGLKPEQVEAQRVKQGRMCAICHVSIAPGRHGNGENIDHDHDTHKPRGLLCRECNKRVMWHDSWMRLEQDYKDKALAYLANPPWEVVGEVDPEVLRWRMRHRKRKYKSTLVTPTED